jgi:hypothetical protein
MEITNLIKSLMQFQAQIEPIKKDKANPFFRSKYADLSAFISTCTPILHKNGLMVIQTCEIQDGKTVLVTTLYHTSGEKIESKCYLSESIVETKKHGDHGDYNIAKGTNPQALASSMTLLRRHNYQAILGIISEDDDDGNKGAYNDYNPYANKSNGNNGTIYKQKETQLEACPECEKPALMRSKFPPAFKYCTECKTKYDPQMNVIVDREKVNA